jgi:RNA polymerase-binding transcription factor DksA
MRRLIVSTMCDYLRDQYAVIYPREILPDGEFSIHELDALLAFKSDPYLEELRQALDRLEAGTYGICISCKAALSQEVLDREPAQRICGTCEQELMHTSLPAYVQHNVAT